MDMAKLVAGWSKDPSTKVGAVIVDANNRVVSLGFNGLPRGIADDSSWLNNREIKYKVILHAEENALAFASRDVSGCSIYTWPMMPCAHCASLIVQRGIARVVAPAFVPERWETHCRLARAILEQGGVEYVPRG